ncbi:MAG: ABC transporter permease, partial [Micromonosporaceae bacterium]|nr:ABC transporter permease [Micromonosporaceae bacterium]
VFDYVTLLIALFLISLPFIVLAPMAQYLFGVELKIFPVTTGGNPSLYKLLLPGMALGTVALAVTLRLTRTSVTENLRADYVRTARAKGLSRQRIIGVHVLRNSLIPIITYLGVSLGDLMAGAIITEGVFNIPGVGFNLFQGIRTEDGPRVVGFVSVLVIIFIITNLVVDILYAVLDPRIRYE